MKYQQLIYFLQNVGRDPSSLMLEDYLTGLKNRRYLMHYLKNQIHWGLIDEHPLSLLIVDIDFFKRINDQYGSGVGDQALVHVAKILKQNVGKKGIPVLYAGDEFMVILPDMKKPNARILASGLIGEVKEHPFFAADAGAEIPLTLSVGVATAPDDAAGPKELVSQVKNALYNAKQAGRNRYGDAGVVARQAIQYLESVSIVGRKFQFTQIRQALKNVGDGISQFVIVDGATGMGKTSFLDVVERNLEKTNLTTLRVSGVIQESFRPYYLVSYIVTELMNQREDMAVGLLDAMDEAEIDRLAYILPQIKDVDGGLKDVDETDREAIFRTFIKFFLALTEGKNLAVLIDDMDFSDPASLHLLRIILKEKSLVLFICGTATQDAKGSPRTIPLDLFRSAYSEGLGIQTIEMSPLTAADIENHVSVIFPQIDIPYGFVRDLLEVTRGNPLFVQEVLRKMISDKKIVQSGDRWKIMKLDKRYFPTSIEDIIRNKILALDGESRRFLNCVSAFGESISLSMLTGVSDEKSAMVHEFLNRIIDQGIVRSDFRDNDETVRFLSKGIHGVVYDGIQPDQKKSLHEQIGNYQEKLYEHHLLPSATFLAHHYKRSDDAEKARHYEQLQADYNKKIFNDREAVRYAVGDAEADGDGGVDEIGDVPLSEESLKYIPKLLQSLLITIRNTRLYPPDSKSVINSVHQFKQLVGKVLEDVERVSIITDKNRILINGQIIEYGNFQSVARKIIDFWDRLQLRCLTFVKGFEDDELMQLLGRICRLEPKKITPDYWQTFSKTHSLTHIFPRQIKYTNVATDVSEMALEKEEAVFETVSSDNQEIEDSGGEMIPAIQRVLSVLLGSYSKLKLYPAHGPVAREAAEQVISELRGFFEKQPVLNIARIETSLLVNGAKLDTSGFEPMAASFIKLLSDARLNSITFLSKVTSEEILGFVAAATGSAEDEMGGAFWQEVAIEKQIKGILFDQRIYEISDAHAGESDAALSMEEIKPPEKPDEEFDVPGFPVRFRDLFLSGDLKEAERLLDNLCQTYKTRDDAGRKGLLDVFDAMTEPADWRPSAAYLKFILTQALPLFSGEVNPDLNRRAGEILFECAEKFILFGEYSLSNWVFDKLRNFSAARASMVFESADASDNPLDNRTIEVVIEDLKSDDQERQQEAFSLVSSLGFWIVPRLIEIIKRESNVRVRHLSAELIKNKGNDAETMLKKALMHESRPEYRARILDVIDSVGSDLMLELSDAVSDSADVVRRSAFRLAERLNTPAVIALLSELARHDDPELAVPAISSLGKLQPPRVVEILVAVAETADNKDVLTSVCRAMGQIADPRFVGPLEKILMPKRRLIFQKKVDTAIRIAALHALSRISDIRVPPLLKLLSKDPDYRVQEALKNLEQ